MGISMDETWIIQLIKPNTREVSAKAIIVIIFAWLSLKCGSGGESPSL